MAEFKNTKTDPYYNMNFTPEEKYLVSKGDVSEKQIKDFHFWLNRNLTLKELKILELCNKNAILLSENDFQK
jgi:hypothetical protein